MVKWKKVKLVLVVVFMCLLAIWLSGNSTARASFKSSCCVTCDGITVCATSVDVYCGSCNDTGGGGGL